MKNTIVRTVAFLVPASLKAVSGMAELGAGLKLPHSIDADLPTKRTALIAANIAHKETILAMKANQLALKGAVATVRRFMALARENLKPRISIKYSEEWTAVGFAGSLTVPSKGEPLLNMLKLAEGYLAAHPVADAGPSLTAGRAAALHASLSAALIAVTQGKEAVDEALNARNKAAKQVERALRTLLRELHQVLDPLDPRWLSFGFNKPGQLKAPEAPPKPTAALVGKTSASVQWGKTARARHFRVWKKVVGKDDDYVAVGSPKDLDFTVEDLPANSEVDIVVTAVNNGGESGFSEVRRVRVGG